MAGRTGRPGYTGAQFERALELFLNAAKDVIGRGINPLRFLDLLELIERTANRTSAGADGFGFLPGGLVLNFDADPLIHQPVSGDTVSQPLSRSHLSVGLLFDHFGIRHNSSVADAEPPRPVIS